MIKTANAIAMIESPKLAKLALVFTMEGDAWGGFKAESEVSMDFVPPRSPEADSPWCIEWEGLRESLIRATNWGDVIGGMGEIVPGSGWLEFHFVNAYGHRQCVVQTLDDLHAAREFIAADESTTEGGTA